MAMGVTPVETEMGKDNRITPGMIARAIQKGLGQESGWRLIPGFLLG